MSGNGFNTGMPQGDQQITDAFPLLVLGLDGTYYEYSVHGSATVHSLSDDIAKRQGVPADDQILTDRATDIGFQPSLFQTAINLSFIGITKNTVLVLSRKSTLIEVMVKSIWGPTLTCYSLQPTETLASVAQRIEAVHGVAASELRISYQGKQVYAGIHKVDGVPPSQVTLQSIGAAEDSFPRLIAKMVASSGSGCHACADKQVRGVENSMDAEDGDSNDSDTL